MKIGLTNAWLFSAPMIVIFGYVAVFHRAVARRMGDMTGYTLKEKALSVIASLAPYPFMITTVVTPLSTNTAAIVAGSLLYAVGLTGFLFSVIHYAKGAPERPVVQGIYGLSRNPMYVSALLMFASIAVMTLSILLAIQFIVIALLQHALICAEEKACAARFGESYERYRERTPRYLFI